MIEHIFVAHSVDLQHMLCAEFVLVVIVLSCLLRAV